MSEERIPLAYIVHPITTVTKSGNKVIDNIHSIKKVCASYYGPDTPARAIPISPVHTLSHSFSVEGDQKGAYHAAIQLMRQCDEVHVYGEWWESMGCLAEVVAAVRDRIPIRIFSDGTPEPILHALFGTSPE